ncbi:MAG: glycosyltransferase family 4 protein, partial [Bacteroidota bacterium]
MKVIILGPAHPYRGGIADTNESLCQTFIEQGHEASIWTFTVQYPEFLFPGKTQYTSDPAPAGIPIRRVLNTVNPFNWVATAKKINRESPDLIIVRYWLPFLAPCLGSVVRLLRKSITTVAMCDNVIPHEKRVGDRAFTRYFTGSFDAFITLSQTTYDELAEFTQKPKTYFPHPINKNLGEKVSTQVARQQLQLDPSGKYLLFFGLVRAYKGLGLTLQALAKASVRELGVQLLVVGEFYEPREKYDAMIAELDLSDRVTIVDHFIPTAEIKYYFSAADLAIQTYHTASQSGVSQLSFNFDCPILVTDVGGLGEVVLHEQLGYVTPKDPGSIADSIVDFFTHERQAEFAANIQVEKRKYSWEAFAERVVALKREV